MQRSVGILPILVNNFEYPASWKPSQAVDQISLKSFGKKYLSRLDLNFTGQSQAMTLKNWPRIFQASMSIVPHHLRSSVCYVSLQQKWIIYCSEGAPKRDSKVIGATRLGYQKELMLKTRWTQRSLTRKGCYELIPWNPNYLGSSQSPSANLS